MSNLKRIFANLTKEQSQRINREIILRLIALRKQKQGREDLQSILEARSEALEVLKQAGENPEKPKE